MLIFFSAFIFVFNSCQNVDTGSLNAEANIAVAEVDSKSKIENLVELTKNFYITKYKGEKPFETSATDSLVELYFPDESSDIDNGLGLNLYITIPANEKPLSSGEKMLFGDLNNDGLEDAIVYTQYSLTSGNANTYNELVAFLGTGEGKFNLVSVTSERELSCEGVIPLNYFNPQMIVEGVIEGERTCYADGDATCCPSIKSNGKAVLKGDKLVKIH